MDLVVEKKDKKKYKYSYLLILLLLFLFLMRCTYFSQSVLKIKEKQIEEYIKEEYEEIKDGMEIPVNDLINKEILTKDELETLKDIDKKCIETSYIVVILTDNGYEFTYKEVCSATTIDFSFKLLGENITLEYGDEFIDPGFNLIEDGKNKNELVVVDNSNFNLDILGTYTITYTYKDNFNEVHILNRNVTIVDTKSPEIILKGSTTLTINVNDIYTEAGYIATDNYDKDITSKVVVNGNIDTSKVGTYTLTYSVKDSSGNKREVQRIIKVEKEDYATLELLGDSIIYLEWGIDTYNEPGFIATLNEKNITNLVQISSNLDLTKLGSYEIIYNLDYNNNKTEVKRTIIVRDTIPPTIVLKGDLYLITPEFEDYIEPGFTATDNYDKDITDKVIINSNLDKNTIGNYTIIYTVEDSSGNKTSTIREVEVINNTKPKILSITYIPDTLTNRDVLVRVESDEDIFITGWSCNANICEKTYIGNALEKVVVRNDEGDRRTIEINVTNIDKDRPTVIEIIKSPNTLTNQDVTVTITATEYISIAGWTCHENTCIKTYSNNIVEIVEMIDSVGNKTNVEVIIDNIDKESPQMTLNGDNPFVLERTTKFNDPGVTITDNYDTNLKATVTGTVDINEVGIYILIYNVCDSFSNCAERLVRQVIVQDTTAPTFTLTKNPDFLTKEDVVATITADENITIAGWTCSEKKCTKTYTINTIENIQVYDLYGNHNEYEVVIDNIDKLDLSITISKEPSTYTSGDVTVTITGNKGITITGWTCNGLVCQKIYSDNTTETVTISDLVGNSIDQEIVIDNIIKDAPIIEAITYDPDTLTNGNVIVTVIADRNIIVNGWTCTLNSCVKVYENNTTENILVKGENNVSLPVEIKVTNIDKSLPEIISVTKTPNNMTQENVTVTITANKEITISGWTCNLNTCSKIYENNTIEAVTLFDNASNSLDYTVQVDNIDRIAPIIILNGLNTITIKKGESFIDPGAVVTDNHDTNINITTTGNVDINNPGTYILKYNACDAALNCAEEVSRTIEVIELVGPILSLELNPTTLTNEFVTATITADKNITITSWSCNANICTKEYNENITEEITAYDEDLISSKILVEIKNIDKRPISLTVTKNPSTLTNQNVTVTLNANDKNISISGWDCATNTCSKEYVDNNTEEVTVTDEAGNTINYTIIVDNIDRINPNIISVIYSTTEITAGNVTVEIIADKNITITGYSCILNVCTKDYSSNVNETITVFDIAGNTAEATIVITNINNSTPVILEISKNPEHITRGLVSVRVTLDRSVEATNNWLCEDNICSKTFSENIVDSVEFGDTLGNKLNTTITIDNIDKIAPVISLKGDNPIRIRIGDEYVEPGVDITDNINSNLEAIITGSVDTNTIGTYELTYKACDNVGNCSTTTREIIVDYGEAPVINVLQNEIKLYLNETYNVLEGVTATDYIEGDITSNITYSGGINNNVPGIYPITYYVKNSLGIEAEPVTINFEVLNIETFELGIDDEMTYSMEVNTTKPKFIAYAFNKYGVKIPVTITDDINTKVVGTYTITFSAEDNGKTVTATREFSVVDTTPPSIKFNLTTIITSPTGEHGIKDGLVVSDNYDNLTIDNVTCTSTPEYNSFQAGTYAITCTVKDSSLNEASATKYVSIVENRFQIYTANQLYNIGRIYPINENYVLMNDIDLSTCSDQVDEKGATGTSTCAENWLGVSGFTGSLDGNGYSISNLKTTSDANNKGLFATTSKAIIRNINFINVDITGRSNVAALVGSANDTAIENITISGVIKATQGNVGSLVGSLNNNSIVNNIIVTADITGGAGYNYFGGIIGSSSSSTISNIQYTGQVKGAAYTGGVVGNASANSHINIAIINSNITGTSYVGGIVGNAASLKITNVEYTGDILNSTSNVGGIVGSATTVTISNGTVKSNINATSSNIGGLAGSVTTNSLVEDISYEGDIKTTSGDNQAGAIGSSSGNVSLYNVRVNTNITKTSSGNSLGGLIGSASSIKIANSYALGTLTASSSSDIGGLIGFANGTVIDKTYSQVETKGSSNVGGFIGRINTGVGRISESYSSGRVTGTNYVGGFIGYQRRSSTLGGNSITDAFSSGNVNGTSFVGTFIGHIYSGGKDLPLTNVYALGKTTGNVGYTGGLIGSGAGIATATSSYWIYQTTGQLSSYSNIGKLMQLKQALEQNNYIDWNFISTWTMDEQSTPYLRALPKPNNVNSHDFVIEDIHNQAGNGTESDPFELWNADQVNNMRNQIIAVGNNYKIYYKVMTDIDMSSYPDFVAIPNFGGELDGQNFRIMNLSNSITTTDTKALFSSTLNGAVIKNLILENLNIKGRGSLAGLAVTAMGTTIENVKINGIITGTRGNIGGIVGTISGNSILKNIEANLNITTDVTYSNTGLISGTTTDTTIENVISTGNISGGLNVGGLIGQANNNTKISNVLHTGNVTGVSYVGGIIGNITGTTTIDKTIYEGNITGTSYVGGIIGSGANTTLRDIEVKSNLIKGTTIGGLIGIGTTIKAQNIIINANIDTTSSNAGGLSGSISGTSDLKNIEYTGNIKVTSGDNIGGLIGTTSGNVTIDSSKVQTNITKNAIGNYVGGFIGNAANTKITNSYVKGNVTASSSTDVAGLIGLANTVVIDKTYSQASVLGSIEVGGFVGRINNGIGRISESYASGDVSGTSYVGGFIGYLRRSSTVGGNSITNAFSSGKVTGTNYVGTFIGHIYSGGQDLLLTNVYGLGKTTGALTTSGGLVGSGLATATASNSYWIYQTSNQPTSYSNIGTMLQITEAKSRLYYENWDFDNIWDISTNSEIESAPYLRALEIPDNIYLGEVESNGVIGRGTEDDPYELWNANQVNNMRDQIAAIGNNYRIYYKVMTDIDMSSYPDFVSIPNFNGELDGQNYRIMNLSNTVTTTDNKALFSNTLNGTVIKNLNLENVSIKGRNNVASLVITAVGTTIENVKVTGSITGTRNNIGGIVSTISGNSIIKNIELNINLTSDIGYSNAGLIAGTTTDTTVENIKSTGNVSGGTTIGGLIGQANATTKLINIEHNGNVTGTNYIGGLIGNIVGTTTIENVLYEGNVVGTSYIGGIAGSAVNTTLKEIEIKGGLFKGYNLGGLIGTGTTINAQNIAVETNVESTSSNVGGIFGTIAGTSVIDGATYKGNITVTSGDNIGGLIGTTSGAITIDASHVDTNINKTAIGNYVGGLIGNSANTTIANSSVLGSVKASLVTDVGGLIGLANTTVIDKTYSQASVLGSANAGGFIGRISNGIGRISESYASGDVSGTSYVGGFIGYLRRSSTVGGNSITNAFSSGKVTGSNYIGTFIGHIYSGGQDLPLTNVYGLGKTTGALTTTGGLIGSGLATATANNSYWIYQTTGQLASYSNIGKLLQLEESLKEESYTNWNFTDIWTIDLTGDEQSTPYLRFLPKPDNIYKNSFVIEDIYNQLGDGSEGSPFELWNANQVNNIRNQIISAGTNKLHYIMMSDIDMSSYKDFVAIPNFSGTLDGQNYRIMNLSNTVTTTDNKALFSNTLNGTVIKNLNLENVSIKGRNNVASLVITAVGTTIDNVKVNGTIVGTRGNIGGIVSTISGNSVIKNIELNINLTSDIGYSNAGLIAGTTTDTTVENIKSTGNVSGGTTIGGLIGQANATTKLINIEHNGNVTGTSYIGGLIGNIVGTTTIENILYEGNVTGTSYVGGLAGSAVNTTLKDIEIKGGLFKGYNLGGLIGTGTTINAQNIAVKTNVESTSSNVGGIFGTVAGTSVIDDATYKGNITVTSGDNIGGLIGTTSGAITIGESHVDTNINKTSTGNYVGGLIGNAANTKITNSSVIGSVKASSVAQVGGLIGQANAVVIDKTYSQASVLGSTNVGGFIGYVQTGISKITESYASGNVSGTSYVGGFIGYLRRSTTVGGNSITDAFSSGSVTGSNYVGGFIGHIYSGGQDLPLTNVYALGKITGTLTTTGGLIGSGAAIATATNSYWIYQTTTQPSSYANIGTLLQLEPALTQNAYIDWDFTDIWTIDLTGDEQSTPYLRALPKPENVSKKNFAIEGINDQLGTGSEYDPFEITTPEQLNNIRNQIISVGTNYKLHYILMNDIDMSSYPDFISIPNFGGELDGQNYKIMNLSNTITTTDNKALFLSTLTGAVIKDLTLENVNIKGRSNVASLVVTATGTTIENVKVNGTVTGTQNNIGGLVSTINGISKLQNVELNLILTSGTAYSNTGLIAANVTDTTIDNINSTGTISAGTNTGGLIGQAGANTKLTNIEHTGNVTGTSYVGGLIGIINNTTTIENVLYEGNVVGTSYIGGLAGSAVNTTLKEIEIKGGLFKGYNLGGLIGTGTTINAQNITIEANIESTSSNIGGLFGTLAGTSGIKDTIYKGEIKVTAGDNIGGFGGSVSGAITINNAHVDSNITKTLTGSNIGGFIGTATNTTITNSSAKGSIIATNNNYVGGFVGIIGNTNITLSYTTVNVSAASNVGGFVGRINTGNSTIRKTYAKGNVTGTTYVSGFAGVVYYSNVVGGNLIEDSFTTGTVSGTDYVGGFIAQRYSTTSNNPTLNNVYAKGKLNYTGTNIGGLVANGAVNVTSSYWIENTGIFTTIGEGTYLTNEQSKNISSYENWNFADIWDIGDDTPYLKEIPIP